MKQKSSFSRHSLLWVIVLCYLTPVICLSIYGALPSNESKNWDVFSIGLLITSSGSLALFWFLTHWEKSFQASQTGGLPIKNFDNFPSPSENNPYINDEDHDLTKRSLAEAQQTQIRLLEEIDVLAEEIQQHRLSKEDSKNHIEKIQTELHFTKREAKQQLEQQQQHIRELQEAIANQKEISEKKQQQMLQLETKVGNLTHEIKTLLQFAEAYNSPLLSNHIPEIEPKKIEFHKQEHSHIPISIESSQEASLQLKECLDIAQKIKGSQRFGSQIYSFLDSPADSFSLDLRRLCDRLRGETKNIILLYSPKDSNLLFASNQIKIITGWSPEKFIQNFSEILQEEGEWKQGINSLNTRSEAHIPLYLKTKSGSPLLLQATLGMIPTGIFRNHIIAILYTNVQKSSSSF